MCSKILANLNVPLKSRKYLCIKIKSQNKVNPWTNVGASVPRGNEPCQSAVQYNVVTNLNRSSHMYNVQAPNVNFQDVILLETSRKQLGKFTNKGQKRRIGHLYQYFPYIQACKTSTPNHGLLNPQSANLLCKITMHGHHN
jgi:hypothetical protein